jgi:Na+/H+ antiporter NhaD/arsenite permease-like protein
VSTLAGSLTITGSVANLLVVERAAAGAMNWASNSSCY